MALYVQPGAAKSEISGEFNDRLKLRIKAPPVDGKANKAVIEFLAQLFGVAKGQIQIYRGTTGRNKTIQISGISIDRVVELIK